MNLEKRIWEKLSEVMDPEVPLNIVEMGLVYDVDFNKESGQVNIIMTLTTPACPLHSKIKKDVETKLSQFDEVNDTKVDFVFDPKWTVDMMTPEARKKIGR